MCGVTGLWKHTDSQAVLEMMSRMVHRGPDADGLRDGPGGMLGHRRLSIMDPEGGNHPIYNESRSHAIVANGEVYNFPQLRQQLEQQHNFRTTCDTEAVLHLFEDKGSETAAALDGMFAFAVADNDQLYLARDPIGIKPLYVGEREGGMIFASELKALAGLADKVSEFPAGTWYHSGSGFHTYYEIPDLQPLEMSVEDHCRRIRRVLEESVTKRLMSDVPLGAFLSGGLDSSLIAAIARQQVDELHTFSVGIAGSNDLAAARLVADHLDTIHHEYIITPADIREHLPEILFYLESFDQDLVRSAVPCFFCSRLAAKYVKVILTGEGADELFAGYTYYKDIPSEDVLHSELRRSVGGLHNVNLQRVDRMTMAHSLEGRVPFLDLKMIEAGMQTPAELKLVHDERGTRIEKWILRKAGEDLLPDEIVWRVKEQFDEGSGAVDALGAELEHFLDGEQADAYAARHAAAGLRSHEECAYHNLLANAYPDPECVLGNVARWSDRPQLDEELSR